MPPKHSKPPSAKTIRRRSMGFRRTLCRNHPFPIDILVLYDLPSLRPELRSFLSDEQTAYILTSMVRMSVAARSNLIEALQGRYDLSSPTSSRVT